MLTAITNGKAGRIWLDGAEHSVSWRDVFRRSEDLLTATIFSRVRYLSPVVLTNFMATLLNAEVATTLGSLKHIDFWRYLKGTHGRVRVQPDVLMWFADALVIVEVKPPFGGNQSLDQWQAQIHAVAQLAKEANDDQVPKRVYFIGLGRNSFRIDEQTQNAFTTDDLFDLSLHTVEWERLTRALPVIGQDAAASDAAVLEDWGRALELFGMVTPTYTWPPLVTWAVNLRLSLDGLSSEHVKPATASSSQSDSAPNHWDALVEFSSKNLLALRK